MTEPSATTDEPTVPEVAALPADGEAGPDPATLVEAELLVEEISIDGMCGVY